MNTGTILITGATGDTGGYAVDTDMNLEQKNGVPTTQEMRTLARNSDKLTRKEK